MSANGLRQVVEKGGKGLRLIAVSADYPGVERGSSGNKPDSDADPRESGHTIGPLTLEVAPGDIVAVVGPNGAGKTTLLRVMAGTLRPTAGSVSLAGIDPAASERGAVARAVAVVAQREEIPEGYRVHEVVAMGRAPHQRGALRMSQADDAIVQGALERSALGELAERRVDELSGGEQKRVSIARALAQEAPVLLLDEPSAALDVKEVGRLFRVLVAEAARGRALVVVTHDLHLAAQYAHRVVLLAKGQIVAQGSAADVMTEELLTRTFGVPMRRAGEAERFFLTDERDG